jgi:hypothetical protein
MARTLKIADLIDRANNYLTESPADARMERIAVHYFVADLLHKSKIYSGFGYVQPYGSPGSDNSRTFFYKSHKL